ncbi:hypothetical protein HHK36_021336 [Tetracentron sinense]|uniref:Uncharacterized protein n=1 Tax=Tetracentron sinense TaxID=13715 RepID=A0A834YRX7_TETSI|nr:hypothetical protein HHK36_021336 [Tetracentron sinense]
MSSLQATMSSKLNSNFDELRWVIQIQRTLEEELEDDIEIPVCIFNVPKILIASKPDSYIPQEVALGPYHYGRPELYEMERYKLSAAKRTQKQFQSIKFRHLVDHLMKLESKIRACYNMYLDFNGETLAWMMAVDASFLLEFLQIYAIKEAKVVREVSSRMSHFVDYAERKSVHNAILRDIVMLENQIPLFLMRKILEFQYSSPELADEVLKSMLMGLYKELSPFKMVKFSSIQVTECAHLLDFLFDMIMPKSESPSEINEADNPNEGDRDKEGSFLNQSNVKKLLSEVWKWLSKLNKGPVGLLKRVLVSKAFKLVLKLPWIILNRLPGLSMLKKSLENTFLARAKEDDKLKNEDSSSTNITSKPPLIEEITIPSVTELSKSGVRFCPTNGGMTTISFDLKTVTLYLPTISLDVNTEVTLRNMVAYEASTASGPLVLARYTELMNGIIDTEEDAKLLRERGIIMNRLKSDEEVANLWNGMNRSIRLTKVPFLDKVIEDVNKYHSGKLMVKVGKFMKNYVFGSWQILTFLATIFFLLMTMFQAFCSVYSCSRKFHVNTINTTTT